MFIDIRNLQERRAQRDSQFENTRDIRNGYLFEVNGSVEGARPGLVWFRARDGNSEPFQVFYNGVIGDLRTDMSVKIERNPKDPARWQIIEFDTGIYFDDQATYDQLPSTSMIPTKEDYEWPPGFPGAKALNIFPRATTDFAVRPTSPASMKARVYSGIYPGATNYAKFGGPVNTKDFTADVPGAGLARLTAITIDNTGTLNYYNGSTFVDGLPMPDASLPTVPASEMLISAIRLVNGMTAIEESNFDLEMRPLMANGTVNIKVSEVWESDFGAVALESDATGNITINAGALTLPSDIIHLGDTDTKISFTDDVQTFTVGGEVLLSLTEGGQDTVKLGDGGDVDINFNDDGIFIGSTGNFAIGLLTPASDDRLTVQGVSGANLKTSFFTGDGDGTDFISLILYGVGLPGIIGNRERLIVQYNVSVGASAPNFRFQTEAAGTGSVLPLVFETGANVDQINLAIDGNVGLSVSSPSTRLDIGAGAVEFDEMTAPGAGAVNTARLYAVDNGAGKTQLAVIFNTGAVQILATQP